MVTRESVQAALRDVRDPDIGRPIGELGILDQVDVEDGAVRLRLQAAVPGSADRLRREVEAALSALEGVDGIEITVGEMDAQRRDGLVRTLRGGASGEETTFLVEGQTEVIAVASGKGGVGKSSVTVNLAAALAAEGQRIGVLDADVWGFSIPRMMGVGGQPSSLGDMILPVQAHGVRMISMGFFVSDETPVIWRGPMLHKAIQQFLGDVYWGRLDALLVDLPPGTGDVSISLASMIPRGSMLVVTTPQDAARRVAERAGRMGQHPNVNLKVLGVVENMTGFVCPDCGEVTDVFGEGGGAMTAEALDVPLLGSVPIQTSLRVGADLGTPVVVSDPDSPAGRAFREIAAKLASLIRSPRGKPLGLSVREG